MIPLKTALRSSVGRKFIMSLSGLALVGFLITHLAGNLLLFIPGGEAYNEYVYKLHSFGPLLIVAEVGLAFVIILHAVMAIRLKIENRSARGGSYDLLKSKGGPSRWNFASTNMVITGSILLVFLILHVWQMRFGAAEAQGYITMIKGQQSRDLYRLVVETFQKPVFVWLYVAVMVFLGAHLRHGFWSAFQSLGVMRPRFAGTLNVIAIIIAIIFAVGFLGIPLYLYYSPLPGVTL